MSSNTARLFGKNENTTRTSYSTVKLHCSRNSPDSLWVRSRESCGLTVKISTRRQNFCSKSFLLSIRFLKARLKEELDYQNEARNLALYRHMLAKEKGVHVPETVAALKLVT